MGLRGEQLNNLFYAAALHDVGLVRAASEQPYEGAAIERLGQHPREGYELLRDCPMFAEAASIVRHHHLPWHKAGEVADSGVEVPAASHILVLADQVDRWIERDVPVLEQVKHIREQIRRGCGQLFCPDCVETFEEVSCREAFWLDIASPRLYTLLVDVAELPVLRGDDESLSRIAALFGRIVDAMSPWTATHTAGVAATAVELARRLHFSPRELRMMETAGYLHDLGKLSVPLKVLNKPGRLTEQEWAAMRGHTYYTYRIIESIGGMDTINEWAAFHHERIDGNGYPFGHRGDDLTLGSRIMAVADVFTAVTEDRPYRKGMDERAALEVLTNLSAEGGIDGDVASVLRHNFDEINQVRLARQSAQREVALARQIA
jgi:HD-GYP domain-containing protein (c-di-GMP phosphodiesterase class II)